MDQGPLVIPQIDAGARFLKEFDAYRPVRAAFWLKDGDDRVWYLYVASDQIDDSNFDIAYGEVMRVAAKNPDPWFDPFVVKVVGSNDPVARDVIAIQQRNPGKNAIRYHGRPLGDVPVEEAYIYPIPLPVPA